MPQQTITTTMTLPSLPASPTLTNPDMILPYGEYDSTPSPPTRPKRPGDSDIMDFSIGSDHLQMGIGPITPTTPIIYGNGTMLSDIGEVTEAESTPGRRTKYAEKRTVNNLGSPMRSSPTMGYDAVMKRSKIGSHRRQVSVESTSTVTNESQAGEVFEDFDDGVSVDDSNFQGDDEESMASAYQQDVEIVQAQIGLRKETRLVGDDDSHSSAALSRRAELILANAKKRLDVSAFSDLISVESLILY